MLWFRACPCLGNDRAPIAIGDDDTKLSFNPPPQPSINRESSTLPKRPTRPPWLIQPGSPRAQSIVPCELWSVTLSQWLRVVTAFKESDLYSSLKESKHFVSLHDMNDHCVKPWTRGDDTYAGGRGIALQMNPQGLTTDLMVSHSWNEDIEECEDALMSFCNASSLVESTAIWFCLFAQYQPQDGAGPSLDGQLQSMPFQRVINSLPRYGMIAIHTAREDIYQRLWCVHEIAECLSIGIDVKPAYSKDYIQWVHRRYKLALDSGCPHRQAVQAAGVQVKTILARCSKKEDETLLFALIQKRGGFDRLDDIVGNFRTQCFDGLLEYQLAESEAILDTALARLRQVMKAEHAPAIVHAVMQARSAKIPESNPELREALKMVRRANARTDTVLDLPKGFFRKFDRPDMMARRVEATSSKYATAPGPEVLTAKPVEKRRASK